MNLLAFGIKITSLYQTEIYFEVAYLNNEEDLEKAVNRKVGGLQSNPDLADYTFMPGSPASSPYFTVQGTSRRHVVKLSEQIVRCLQALGEHPSGGQ
jgi:hypothetical protein